MGRKKKNQPQNQTTSQSGSTLFDLNGTDPLTTTNVSSSSNVTGNSWWYTAAANSNITFNVSTSPTYTFGFTGWDNGQEPIYDPFDVYVWEQRKLKGIEEPYPQPIGYKPREYSWISSGSTYVQGSQILFSGTITIPSPRYHRQVYGITAGSTDDSNAEMGQPE